MSECLMHSEEQCIQRMLISIKILVHHGLQEGFSETGTQCTTTNAPLPESDILRIYVASNQKVVSKCSKSHGRQISLDKQTCPQLQL